MCAKRWESTPSEDGVLLNWASKGGGGRWCISQVCCQVARLGDFSAAPFQCAATVLYTVRIITWTVQQTGTVFAFQPIGRSSRDAGSFLPWKQDK